MSRHRHSCSGTSTPKLPYRKISGAIQMSKNKGIEVKLSRNRLVISIGVYALADAAAMHEAFWDGVSGPDVPTIPVTNPRVFAEAVMEALLDEDEEGSTAVHNLLDKAMYDAVEQGCEGVDHDAMDAANLRRFGRSDGE